MSIQGQETFLARTQQQPQFRNGCVTEYRGDLLQSLAVGQFITTSKKRVTPCHDGQQNDPHGPGVQLFSAMYVKHTFTNAHRS